MPTDVLREEEILITIQNIDKQNILQHELDVLEKNRIDKYKEQVDTVMKEQEHNRVFIVELLHDNTESNEHSTSNINSIKISNLNVSYSHKHISLNVTKFMDQYKTYCETINDVDKEGTIIPPYKIKCTMYNNYVCSRCIHKKQQLTLIEDTIRKLFYEKYELIKDISNQTQMDYRFNMIQKSFNKYLISHLKFIE